MQYFFFAWTCYYKTGHNSFCFIPFHCNIFISTELFFSLLLNAINRDYFLFVARYPVFFSCCCCSDSHFISLSIFIYFDFPPLRKIKEKEENFIFNVSLDGRCMVGLAGHTTCGFFFFFWDSLCKSIVYCLSLFFLGSVYTIYFYLFLFLFYFFIIHLIFTFIFPFQCIFHLLDSFWFVYLFVCFFKKILKNTQENHLKFQIDYWFYLILSNLL